MKAFYKVSISKQAVGSAIMHQEPPLQGEVLIKVSDASTQGDSRIVVMECDEKQHQDNLFSSAVVELSEEDAMKLAPKYQPKRSFSEFNPRTRKEDKIEVPAADLKRILKFQEEKGGQERVVAKKKARRKTPTRSGS